MDAININDLSKSFNRRYAVKNLNMTVPKGSVYGFIGENGAGKSTTQKMICGLLVPDEGSIEILGKQHSDADTRTKVGVLIENPGVYTGWTAYENLMMQALNIGLPKPRAAVKDALKTVGLADTGKKKVSQFSLGMKQRLGVAAAFLGNPELLILDEPINGLDPEGIRDVRQTLQRLNREYGTTILISSHILGELSKIATHYGIIRDGKMIKEISADELSRECRDYIRIKVDEPERILNVLKEKLLIESSEIVGGEIHLFNFNDGKKVNEIIFAEGIAASEISFHQLDLEEYFVDLTGGASNA